MSDEEAVAQFAASVTAELEAIYALPAIAASARLRPSVAPS